MQGHYSSCFQRTESWGSGPSRWARSVKFPDSGQSTWTGSCGLGQKTEDHILFNICYILVFRFHFCFFKKNSHATGDISLWRLFCFVFCIIDAGGRFQFALMDFSGCHEVYFILVVSLSLRFPTSLLTFLLTSDLQTTVLQTHCHAQWSWSFGHKSSFFTSDAL